MWINPINNCYSWLLRARRLPIKNLFFNICASQAAIIVSKLSVKRRFPCQDCPCVLGLGEAAIKFVLETLFIIIGSHPFWGHSVKCGASLCLYCCTAGNVGRFWLWFTFNLHLSRLSLSLIPKSSLLMSDSLQGKVNPDKPHRGVCKQFPPHPARASRACNLGNNALHTLCPDALPDNEATIAWPAVSSWCWWGRNGLDSKKLCCCCLNSG